MSQAFAMHLCSNMMYRPADIAGHLCDNFHAQANQQQDIRSLECQQRRCSRQDCKHTDYLGYRWRSAHFYHAALLNVGVILDYPALISLEGLTLEGGKDTWIACAQREKQTERLIKLLGAAHTALHREERE